MFFFFSLNPLGQRVDAKNPQEGKILDKGVPEE